MKDFYDFSKGVKKPEIAKQRREYGYKVRIVDGDSDNSNVVKEYFVSPEQIAEANKRRDEWRRNNCL